MGIILLILVPWGASAFDGVYLQSASYFIPVIPLIKEVEAEELPEPPKPTFYPVPKWALSSCVNTAKFILGKENTGAWGNANQIKPDKGLEADVGLVVITNEGRWGHIAVVVSKSEEFITIWEGNWIPNIKTERTLRIDDKRIKGYKKY